MDGERTKKEGEREREVGREGGRVKERKRGIEKDGFLACSSSHCFDQSVMKQ